MEVSMPRLCLLLILPFLPGCLAVGYPSVTYTPSVASLPPDVHAFRSTFEIGGMSIIMTGGERIGGSVEEIPITDGRLDSLDHVYFAYDIGGIPVTFFERHDWKILLYRPGYELIEIPSRWYGEKLFQPRIDHLDWKPANDIESQLANLDRICQEPAANAPSEQVRRFAEKERARLLMLNDCTMRNVSHPN
jgi:hypothetical protein